MSVHPSHEEIAWIVVRNWKDYIEKSYGLYGKKRMVVLRNRTGCEKKQQAYCTAKYSYYVVIRLKPLFGLQQSQIPALAFRLQIEYIQRSYCVKVTISLRKRELCDHAVSVGGHLRHLVAAQNQNSVSSVVFSPADVLHARELTGDDSTYI